MGLSILLITYNQEKYIQQCVESILMQEAPFDVEIIVADDHSTDTTLEIITRLLSKSKFPYKVLADDKNLGMQKNYQRGFAACSGKFIAVMEGDDYWSDPKRLTKHIKYLDAHPECVMSFNRLIVYNEEKGTYTPQKWDHPDSVENITTAMLARKNHIGNLSACVIRRSAFVKLNSDLHELGFADWMLGMVMGEQGSLVKLGEPMSVYRVHDFGLWSGRSKTENFQKMINHIIDKYDNYLGYRYHDEFMDHKRRLEAKLRKSALKYAIQKNTPGFFIRLVKILVPVNIRKALWKT